MSDKISFDGVELDVEVVRAKLAEHDAAPRNFGGHCGVRVCVGCQSNGTTAAFLTNEAGNQLGLLHPSRPFWGKESLISLRDAINRALEHVTWP